MSDPVTDLITRIERIIEDHTLINGADECTCGVLWEIQNGFTSTDGSTCYDSHLAAAITKGLDCILLDFGAWLTEEISGKPMTRIDLESCLADWKGES